MRLFTAPLTQQNIESVAHLWGDRDALGPARWRRAVAAAAGLLADDRARGRVTFDDDGRVRAFGLTTFVHEDYAASYVARPHAQVGRSVLVDRGGLDAVLDEHGVAERNAGEGLQLAVLNQGHDVSPEELDHLLGTMIEAFADAHRGFRLAGVINEIFGEPGVTRVGQIGVASEFHRFTIETSRGPLSSGVWMLTREEARRRSSLLLPMFTYNPPRIRFTRPERQLLLAALSGATDAALADVLGVARTAIRARWLRIQARAMRHPQLQVELERIKGYERRGGQFRHVILDYVRRNPSELTPYRTTAARKSVADTKKVLPLTSGPS